MTAVSPRPPPPATWIRQRIGAVMVDTPVEIAASATIVFGKAGTNRVVVRRVNKPRRAPNAGRAARRRRKPNGVVGYKVDRSVIGRGTIKTCVAFPPDELIHLDQLAERVQMSRSRFIRQAVKHFGVKIFPDGKLGTPRR